MRQALIADIHANLTALEAVIADCDAQRVDEIVCLGDMVGYGPQPAECVDLVRQRCTWALCGDEDAARFMIPTLTRGSPKRANNFGEWIQKELAPRWYSLPSTKERWKWMEKLPASHEDSDVLYVHASPRDPLMEYVLEEDFADRSAQNKKATEIFSKIKRVCFCAHTRRPGLVEDQSQWIKPEQLPAHSFELQSPKTLVNIGAVGRPGDKNPQSCYVVFDNQANRITFCRVAYDLELAHERIKRVPALNETRLIYYMRDGSGP